MTIHTFPCGGISVIGKEPRGEQPIGMAEWETTLR